MKKIIYFLILISAIFGLSILVIKASYGWDTKIYWSTKDMIKDINNDYFKTSVVVDDGDVMIIKNEVSGEYFLIVDEPYKVSITPIVVNKDKDEIEVTRVILLNGNEVINGEKIYPKND